MLFEITIMYESYHYYSCNFSKIWYTLFGDWFWKYYLKTQRRFLYPISEVSKDFKSDKIQKEKEFTFVFYEKEFKVRDKINYETIKYRNLHKVFETKYFFYLYGDKTHAYLLDKSGFTKGTVDEFSNFMKKKFLWRFKSK